MVVSTESSGFSSRLIRIHDDGAVVGNGHDFAFVGDDGHHSIKSNKCSLKKVWCIRIHTPYDDDGCTLLFYQWRKVRHLPYENFDSWYSVSIGHPG